MLNLRALAAALVLAAALPQGALAAGSPSIHVLSNRADLISAGDALVAVGLPAGVNPSKVRVTVGGRDVTGAFAVRPNGRFEGLVTDLALGENVLAVKAPGGPAARTTIVNHPNGGPVFSGPQVQPWVCQSTAVDEQCNQPATYDYQYKSSVDGQLKPYDPDNPPSDVATTTTDEGHTVPFVIRTETGYQDRDQYRITVLYDPERPWQPWAPQKQWNHKLLITHGASCGIDRQAGSAPSTTGDTVAGSSPMTALGRGFAVMSTALNNAGHNCNIVTQAESMVMAKERLVEQYGEIRYTIGTGCSGGSLTQQQVANAYPGIYQGILPQCSFPDAWSTGQQLVDYHLVRQYVENPAKWGLGVVWTPDQIAAVEGHPNHVNAVVLDSLYWTSLGDPTSSCAGVSAQQRYHPQDNPDGVRCTLADYMVNVFGRRSPDVWIEPERKVGQGFAGLPLDNVGVQYGLEALTKGQITPEQFVDLNDKIGGGDIDINPTPERLAADRPALAYAYRSGAVNSANNLDQVAIIDLRGPDHGAFHDAYRSWAVRARLEREQGHFRNHVIWMGHVPLIGDPRYTTEGLLAMDRWLTAVEADGGGGSLAQRIVRNRPEDVQDRCSQVPGVEQVALPGVGQVCRLQHVESRYGTPRTVAGEGVETDLNKCALRPLRRSDYYPVQFTDAQWERLEKAFPTGVCDWGRRGVDQAGAVPWQTYQQPDGSVVYGGRPLGPAPAGSGEGWTSGAFASWRAASGESGGRSPKPGKGARR
jgi:hypothetical protein